MVESIFSYFWYINLFKNFNYLHNFHALFQFLFNPKKLKWVCSTDSHTASSQKAKIWCSLSTTQSLNLISHYQVILFILHWTFELNSKQFLWRIVLCLWKRRLWEDNSVKKIIDVTYLDFLKNMSPHTYLRDRAILTPINVIVDDINKHLLEIIPGETHIYDYVKVSHWIELVYFYHVQSSLTISYMLLCIE